MFLRLFCGAIICLGGVHGALAQDYEDDYPYEAEVSYEEEIDFPYRGFINADDVYVRSGPGQNYYPTQRLRHGDVVEVYRHDPGGWYAIRPPIDSFSWVSAEFVEPGEGRMATIKGDHVVARVGSAFSDIRDVIQIRLNNGEPIEVFEARRIGTGESAQTWYKIAPPAGEFRWISGKFIDREPTNRTARRRNPNNNLLIARQARQDREAAEPLDREGDQPRGRAPRSNGYNDHDDDYDAPRARFASHARSPERDDPRADDRRADDAWRSPRRDRHDRPEVYSALEAHRSTRSRASTPRGDGDLVKELEELDLALSSEVTKDPTAWNLQPIRSRTDALLARSDTALDRGRVRLVQRKVARFEDIQLRQASLQSTQLAADLRNRDVIQASLGGSMGVRSNINRFDGTGRLTQVYPAQAGVAGFALVDREGRITQYVTAGPGVNLRPLLGQEVGVQGTLGYMPDARTQHVTAQRVSVIGNNPVLR